jgi:hypothetical protein
MQQRCRQLSPTILFWHFITEKVYNVKFDFSECNVRLSPTRLGLEKMGKYAIVIEIIVLQGRQA